MGDKNGKGDKPDAERTPLEQVAAQIEARRASEEGVEEAASSSEDDPTHKWKKPGEPLTLEVLHAGLIAVSQFSEAAIEGGIKMAADLNKALPVIERTSSQVTTIASKVESISSHVHQVDGDVVQLSKTMNTVRRDVQFVKDTVAEMAEPVRQIPALKAMLGEILARLPEPEEKTKTRRVKRKKTS